MADQSKIINGLLNEHEGIRENLERAGEAITDWQNTLDSEIAHAREFPTELLRAKQWKLVQAIGYLEEGLSNHFQRERTEVRPFVGLLAEALGIEQSEIIEQLKRVRLALTGTDFEGSGKTGLAAKAYLEVKRDLEAAYRSTRDHSTLEDSILRMLLKAVARTEARKERNGRKKAA